MAEVTIVTSAITKQKQNRGSTAMGLTCEGRVTNTRVAVHAINAAAMTTARSPGAVVNVRLTVVA